MTATLKHEKDKLQLSISYGEGLALYLLGVQQVEVPAPRQLL